MVPKPDSAVWGTSSELGQVFVELALFHGLKAIVTYLLVILNGLYVMDGATVGHECAVDSDLVKFLNVPNEHHPIWVKCHSPLVRLINMTRYNISEFRFFPLRNLNLADSCFNISWPQRRRLAERKQVLQWISRKHPNDAISTCAEKAVVRCMQAKSTLDFDVHPLNKLAGFIVNVDMAICCQGEHFLVVDSHSYENL